MPHDHHHHCDHSHGHGHGGHHHHAPKDFGRAFVVGITLNVIFVVAEIVYGLKAGSLALLADAWHNVSDVAGLILAFAADRLSRRGPSARFTYGLKSSSLLAAMANATMLLVAVGGITWEALMRFSHPAPAAGGTIMAVAAIGIVINGGTALMFMSGKDSDINLRGAYLHMMADAAISLGVVVTGALIALTGLLWLDPLASIVISLFIVRGAWDLLKESLSLSLLAVPKSVDAASVKTFLAALPGVAEVHDLHIWALGATEIACSAHLVMKAGHPGDTFLKELSERLAHDFGIGHATVQIEIGDSGADCPLAPDHVI